MKKAIIPLAVFFALAALFMLMLNRMNTGEYNPRDIPTEFIGKPAPEFMLPDLLDPTVQVSPAQYRGRPWLLNVWGTWCVECWREHEYLVALSRSRGIPIVGLNWRDEAAEARGMLERLGNPFDRIAFDPNSDVAMEWGVYGAPETFLIDADGIIRVKHKGALNEAVWRARFEPYFAGGTS